MVFEWCRETRRLVHSRWHNSTTVWVSFPPGLVATSLLLAHFLDILALHMSFSACLICTITYSILQREKTSCFDSHDNWLNVIPARKNLQCGSICFPPLLRYSRLCMCVYVCVCVSVCVLVLYCFPASASLRIWAMICMFECGVVSTHEATAVKRWMRSLFFLFVLSLHCLLANVGVPVCCT